mmetsp:Transcript_43229/g.77688  ORF Transcript_43229/g.77688 Transcript_43229/m.77688 type:complete len:98 (-) Transcript_43229:639-932(-)
MGQFSKSAAMKGAPGKFVKGESVRSMGQSKLPKPVAMKDAPTKPEKEEYVSGMGQLLKFAVMKDAPTKSVKEECVCGMGQLVKPGGNEGCANLARKG